MACRAGTGGSAGDVIYRDCQQDAGRTRRTEYIARPENHGSSAVSGSGCGAAPHHHSGTGQQRAGHLCDARAGLAQGGSRVGCAAGIRAASVAPLVSSGGHSEIPRIVHAQRVAIYSWAGLYHRIGRAITGTGCICSGHADF